MVELSRYHIERALTAIQPQMTKAAARSTSQILELLGENDTVTVGAVNEALFPYSTKASANAQLNRLISDINKAAGKSSSSLRMIVSTDKKRGQDRSIWFEGDVEGPTSTDTPELNGTQNLIHDTRGLVADDPVVVLMTFNKHERDALHRRLSDIGPQYPQDMDEINYVRLGNLNSHTIVHLHCHGQGQLKAEQSARDAIGHWNPSYVIAVGIAAGLNENKQNRGDVLVPDMVQDTEMVRLNADGTTTDRNRPYHVFSKLIDQIKTMDITCKQNLDWPTIHFGPLLCGNALLDHGPSREKIKTDHAKGVGYEMEAVGIASTAERNDIRWLIVKGISDWGDGTKTKDKSKYQKLAAENAAMVARKIIENILRSRPRNEPPEFKPRELSEIESAMLIRDTHGAPASLAKDGAGEGGGVAAGSGIPVMDYLLEWIDEPNELPLFALLGEYGMGKTITCQRLYQALQERRTADQTARLPVYLDLRHVSGLDKGLPTLKGILEECLARGLSADNQPEAYSLNHVLRWMDNGAVIIFDGLDEVLVKLPAADGQVFTNTLLKLLSDYKARPSAKSPAKSPAKILISCRTQYFRTLRDQQNHFTGQERGDKKAEHYRAVILLPLTEKQISHYLETAVPGISVGKLVELIGSVHNLTELTRRPYTLKLVSEFIPDIKAAQMAGRPVYGVTLYRKMVQRWLDRDSGKHHIRPMDKMLLAAHLAAFIWREGRGSLSINEIENWFHLWIKDQPALAARYQKIGAEQLEEDLRTATFLSRRDGEENTFQFAHTSLQEFFLADFLLSAVSQDLPELWDIPVPSIETLDFLGQLFQEQDTDSKLMKTLQGWRKDYRKNTSELLLAYALRAHRKGWPLPVLHGIDLRGIELCDQQIGTDHGTALNLGPANFSGAKLRRTLFNGVLLQGADFTKAQMHQARFQSCNLNSSCFDGTNFTATIFRQCELNKAEFQNALGINPQFLHCRGTPELSIAPSLISARIAPHPEWDQLSRHASLSWVAPGPGARFCAFSPDGSRIVSAGSDGTLRIWQADSGEEIMALKGHDGWVMACAFSPDGSRIVSAGFDGTLRIWQADSGEEIMVCKGHNGWVNACAFSPDGSRIVSAGYGGTLRICQADSGEEIMVRKGHGGPVNACAFSPDGSRIVSAGSDGTLRIWQADSGEEIMVLKGHGRPVNACAFSPDGSRLVSAGSDGTLRIWQADSGEEIMVLKGHDGRVRACAFSSDGSRIVSAGYDGTLRIWQADSGEEIMVRKGHGGPVNACAFSPDGSRIVSAGDDGTLRIWQADNGEEIMVLKGNNDWVRACAFSPDGSRIVSAGGDGTLRIWQADSGEGIMVRKGHEGSVWAYAFSPDGSRIVSAGDDGTLRIWQADSGEEIMVCKGHDGRVNACAFSPDGSRIVSAGDDGTLRIWQADSGEEIMVRKDHGPVNACAFSPDGSRIVSAGDDGTLRIWQADSGEEVMVCKGHDSMVMACAFSPDGSRVVSAGFDGMLRIWQADSGEEIMVLKGHVGPVMACAFSPDGSRIVSAGYGGTPRIWQADSGEEIMVLKGHDGNVNACAFSPDGSRIVSAGSDGTLRVWQADSGKILQIYGQMRGGGSVVWNPGENKIINATGNAWRGLAWRIQDGNNIRCVLPLESCGKLPGLNYDT